MVVFLLPIANDDARVGQRLAHVDVEAFIFFVGDDWTVAVGVVLALVVTYEFSHAGVPAWWITPAAVLILLAVSVRKNVRSRNAPTGSNVAVYFSVRGQQDPGRGDHSPQVLSGEFL